MIGEDAVVEDRQLINSNGATIQDCTYNDYPPLVDYEIPHLAPPPARIFDCVCGTIMRVRGIRAADAWHYRSKCPGCGNLYSNLYPLRTKCPVCGAYSTVTRGNHFGSCRN